MFPTIIFEFLNALVILDKLNFPLLATKEFTIWADKHFNEPSKAFTNELHNFWISALNALCESEAIATYSGTPRLPTQVLKICVIVCELTFND